MEQSHNTATCVQLHSTYCHTTEEGCNYDSWMKNLSPIPNCTWKQMQPWKAVFPDLSWWDILAHLNSWARNFERQLVFRSLQNVSNMGNLVLTCIVWMLLATWKKNCLPVERHLLIQYWIWDDVWNVSLSQNIVHSLICGINKYGSPVERHWEHP